MKNILKRFTKLFSGLAVSMLATGMILAPMKVAALSIPYTGDNTPPAPYPAFNVFTGTPYSGDESDFLRGKLSTDSSDSKNVVDAACQDGTKFTLRVYVHNGASQYENGTGNGPSVAHGVKVKVGNVTGKTSPFSPNATISASNAATVSDDMRINCTNGSQFAMNYVSGTAKQYSIAGGSQALSDTIVTTGAPIGTVKPDGNVWGCWDQRVYVTLEVVVKKVAPPVVISTGECKVTDLTILDKEKRSVKVSVTGSTNNATIVGYEIDFGDSTKSSKQNDTHTYAKDGTYNIVTKVQVKFADGHTEWKTAAACTKQVTFKNGTTVVPPTPPVTPPVVTTSTSLPDTGAGSVAAVFAAFSVAGTMAYRVFTTRRLNG